MVLKHGGRVAAPIVRTTSEGAQNNVDLILEFFGSYLVDKSHFYSLWVENDPVVITPFVTSDVANCGSDTRVGWDSVRSFFDPIHDHMHGKFDWTIDEFLIGENPNIIMTKSRSDIDIKTDEVWGNKHLSYKGRYVQIFKFEDGRIKSFEEYYDTALLNRVYGS